MHPAARRQHNCLLLLVKPELMAFEDKTPRKIGIKTKFEITQVDELNSLWKTDAFACVLAFIPCPSDSTQTTVVAHSVPMTTEDAPDSLASSKDLLFVFL